MRIHKNVLVRSVAFAVLGFAFSISFVVRQPARANCQALIDALRAATETVLMTGKNAEKNRAGLIGKLDNATT